MRSQTPRRTLSPLTALASLALAGAFACDRPEQGGEATEPASATERAAIEEMLSEYLPALGNAYGTGDIEPLRQWAVERVLAQVEKRIYDLQQQGLITEATLQGFVIEDVSAWGNDFAMVTTLETWDLVHRSTGGSVVSERPGSRSRVRYQMKKLDGRWRVFYRELQAELD